MPPQKPQIVSVTIHYWDGTSPSLPQVEIHIPTPGIYRFMGSQGNYIEVPFSSVKYLDVAPATE